MKSALAFVAALAAIVTPALAAETLLAPGDVPAGVYEIVTKETLVRYEVLHFGYSDYWGTFPGATGTMTLDPANLAATRLDVKVPIVGVETTNRELNGQLFSNEFFDGETYPDMHFVSTAVTRTGPRTADIAGDLTIHNITKPVVLAAEFVAGGPSPFAKKETIIGFRAKGVVRRSDFGLGKWVPIVSDETRIVISAAFRKT
jgi:polyisoprenoid-binding protein YceI